MKVLSNTLAVEVETWDDPGDYPSGAGGGALPSYKYVAEISGQIELEMEPEDEVLRNEMEVEEGEPVAVADYMMNYEGIDPRPNVPRGVVVTEWNVVASEGLRATFEVKEFDASEYGVDEYRYKPGF